MADWHDITAAAERLASAPVVNDAGQRWDIAQRNKLKAHLMGLLSDWRTADMAAHAALDLAGIERDVEAATHDGREPISLSDRILRLASDRDEAVGAAQKMANSAAHRARCLEMHEGVCHQELDAAGVPRERQDQDDDEPYPLSVLGRTRWLVKTLGAVASALEGSPSELYSDYLNSTVELGKARRLLTSARGWSRRWKALAKRYRSQRQDVEQRCQSRVNDANRQAATHRAAYVEALGAAVDAHAALDVANVPREGLTLAERARRLHDRHQKALREIWGMGR